MANVSNVFDILSNDLIITIARWVAEECVQDFVHMQRVNKRMKSILGEREVFTALIEDRKLSLSDVEVTSLDQLALHEYMQRYGLLQENRVKFDYASMDMDEGSRPLMEGLWIIFQVFRNLVVVVVDAHCGTMAPTGVAPEFSRARGMAVRVEIEEYLDEESIAIEIEFNAWGRQVTEAASQSSHKFSDLAREGKGWVDVFLKMGGLELPSRPEYYDGLTTVG